MAGYSRGTHGVLTAYSQLRVVTAERDALAKAHAQCEALYAALAAQHGLKANAHGAAQPLLAGRWVLTGTHRRTCILAYGHTL